jgi:hypothetical protein
LHFCANEVAAGFCRDGFSVERIRLSPIADATDWLRPSFQFSRMFTIGAGLNAHAS